MKKTYIVGTDTNEEENQRKYNERRISQDIIRAKEQKGTGS